MNTAGSLKASLTASTELTSVLCGTARGRALVRRNMTNIGKAEKKEAAVRPYLCARA
jgi:hypothetical protein